MRASGGSPPMRRMSSGRRSPCSTSGCRRRGAPARPNGMRLPATCGRCSIWWISCWRWRGPSRPTSPPNSPRRFRRRGWCARRWRTCCRPMKRRSGRSRSMSRRGWRCRRAAICCARRCGTCSTMPSAMAAAPPGWRCAKPAAAWSRSASATRGRRSARRPPNCCSTGSARGGQHSTGSGLGLAIVRSICRRLGGDAQAGSGPGFSVALLLPAAAQPGDSTPAQSSASSTSPSATR